MDWDEFSAKFAAELERLGVSDHEARFLGFDAPDERIFALLAALPNGVGAETLYSFLGADLAALEKQENEAG